MFERIFRALQLGFVILSEALKLETVGGEATVPPPGVDPLTVRLADKVFHVSVRIRRVE